MNYYEHHIGDYAEATAHLSFVEDAAYSRLIRKYYAQEKCLPADIKAVQRLVGARTKEEREAVATVLEEFFELLEDGYHQARCDEAIAKYLESQPDREAKRDAERDRQRRARERRKQLFEALREHGIVPDFNAPMHQLQDMLSRAQSQHVTHVVTDTVTRDDTITQTPDTNHQSPDLNPEANTASENLQVPVTNTTAGAVSQLCRKHGVMTNPSDPRILKIVADGVAMSTIEAALQAARDAKPNEVLGIGYVAAILTRWAADAAALNVRGAAKPNSSTTTRDQSRAAAAASIGLGARHDEQPLTFDAETGRVAD